MGAKVSRAENDSKHMNLKSDSHKNPKKQKSKRESFLERVISALGKISVQPIDDDYGPSRPTEARSTPDQAHQHFSVEADEEANFAQFPQNNLINEPTDFQTWGPMQGQSSSTSLTEILGFISEDKTMSTSNQQYQDVNQFEDAASSTCAQAQTYSVDSSRLSEYQSGCSSHLDMQQMYPPQPSCSYQVLQPVVSIADEFKAYIVSLDNDPATNEQIFFRTQEDFQLRSLNILEKADEDKDTLLMTFIANKRSVQGLAEKWGFCPSKEQVIRLSRIYTLVAKFAAEKPLALLAKNNQQHCALHLAMSTCSDHPLIAAYIAEKLQQQGYNFPMHCTAIGCRGYGPGNLLHCLVLLGDMHAEVLRNLLKLERVQALINTTEHNSFMSPLHLAIKEHTNFTSRTDTIISILVHHGAQLSDNWKRIADEQGMDVAVQLLLEVKANIWN